MKYQELHTYTLEKLFGPVQNSLIRQDDKIRMVHLVDKNKISRTLGIVKFHLIENDVLKNAHEDIQKGAMLGKTLLEYNIDFDKELIGSMDVELPEWLRNDFKTNQRYSKAFMSRITLNQIEGDEERVYSELIEVVPPEYVKEFENRINRISVLDSNWASLIGEAGLKIRSNEK